jgi:hypothetical protein
MVSKSLVERLMGRKLLVRAVGELVSWHLQVSVSASVSEDNVGAQMSV